VSARIEEGTRFTAAGDGLSADLDGETVLLDLPSGHYYGLDRMGSRIWGMVRDSLTFGEMRDAVVREYDVTPERCEEDLRAFLTQLCEKGLIVPQGPSER
jgi:hypothetical protein